jgi:hypothetical protein
VNQEIKVDINRLRDEIELMKGIHSEIVSDSFDIALISSRGDTVEEIRNLEEELKGLKTNLGVLYKNTYLLYKKISEGFSLTDKELAKLFISIGDGRNEKI